MFLCLHDCVYSLLCVSGTVVVPVFLSVCLSVWFVAYVSLATKQLVVDPREYCAAEVFQPKCLVNEVVLITDAHYGRMQVGECVRTDYGYIGCTTDVIDFLDDECSGKRSCSLRIPDTKLEHVNACPKEFKAYLNVSFECIPGE